MTFRPNHLGWLSTNRDARARILLTTAMAAFLTIGFGQGSIQAQATVDRSAAVQESRKPQDATNGQGLTALVAAAAVGDVSSVKSLLSGGASVDARDSAGRTPLVAAIQGGHIEAARVLVAAGADLNVEARYIGSPLNVAENAGFEDLAAFLLASGAHSTGKSIGDSVCVLPWGGQGFCGTVKTFSVRSVQLNVTRIVGCEGGCPARQECSSLNPVGGVNGLHEGEQIAVPSWCLTSTGVSKSEANGTSNSDKSVK